MISLIIFLILLALGYGVGSYIEKKHFKSIREREEAIKYLPTIMLKRPLNLEDITEFKLVNGEVVISIDYFKKFVASLINIFGGGMSSYETLLDRARREAILRMKADAKGASEVINVRIETSSIYKGAKQNIGAVEIFAYGTAIYR